MQHMADTANCSLHHQQHHNGLFSGADIVNLTSGGATAVAGLTVRFVLKLVKTQQLATASQYLNPAVSGSIQYQ